MGSPKVFTNESSPSRAAPSESFPLQEKQPRVVVKTIREGEPTLADYNDQYPNPSMRFVPIPVQVERSAGGSQQGFTSPPYHSDPYYRQNNA